MSATLPRTGSRSKWAGARNGATPGMSPCGVGGCSGRGSRWEMDERLNHMTLTRRFLRGVAAKLDEPPKALRKAATVASVVSLARSNEELVAVSSQWDGDLMLLGTPGGTVDLRDGKLRPARQLDYITKQTCVTPASRGAVPVAFLTFLERIFRHDLELIGYVKRLAGYALTGLTLEQILSFWWGEGGNGKGVLLGVLKYIMGDYAAAAPPDLLLAMKGERHPTDMAMLRGARLVIASEITEGRSWDELKLKALTGGDPITARFMRQDNFTFDPQATLIQAGNHKPSMRSVDEGFRRRVQLLPFLQKIPKAERDGKLLDKLKLEGPLIYGGRSTDAWSGSGKGWLHRKAWSRRVSSISRPRTCWGSGSRNGRSGSRSTFKGTKSRRSLCCLRIGGSGVPAMAGLIGAVRDSAMPWRKPASGGPRAAESEGLSASGCCQRMPQQANFGPIWMADQGSWDTWDRNSIIGRMCVRARHARNIEILRLIRAVLSQVSQL